MPKTLTDSSTKTLTGKLDSSKALTGEQARDRDKGDANDPRRDTQHAKAIDTEDTNAKDNTARDTDGSDTYPLVGPRPEEAPDNDYGTLEQSTGTEGSPEHTRDMMNKTLYSQHRKDEERDEKQDAIDPGLDNPHAKNDTITAEDITNKPHRLQGRDQQQRLRLQGQVQW